MHSLSLNKSYATELLTGLKKLREGNQQRALKESLKFLNLRKKSVLLSKICGPLVIFPARFTSFGSAF